jgi:hypothetical protein
MDLITKLNTAPLWMILGALLLYLARQLFEGRLKSEFSRMEKLFDSSLGVKTGLRSEEKDALVEFRMKIEEWEYFLFNAVNDLMTQATLGAFDPGKFYKKDTKTFGAVRAAAVKASVLLRSRDLEKELLETIVTARGFYYPLIMKAINETIVINQHLMPYVMKNKHWEKGDFKDASLAPSQEDAARMNELQCQLTASLAEFSRELIANYVPIAEQLDELKDKINAHIYRALDTHKIDEAVRS